MKIEIKLLHGKSGQRSVLWAWRVIRGGKVPTELMALCTDNRSRRVYVSNNLQYAHAYVIVKGVVKYIDGVIFGYHNLKAGPVSLDPSKSNRIRFVAQA